MADFKLNAQVNLLSPSAANLKSVANTIQKGLGKSANIKLKIGGKGLRTLNANLATLNKNVTSTQTQIQKLGATYAKATAQSSNFAKAQQQVATGAKKASQGVQGASNALQGFGKNISKTIKNAAAFSLVAGPIFGVQRALVAAAKEAAEFQKELLKISQVTGESVDKLGSLVNVIDRLSTSLGVNAKELAETARVIAQTGRSGKELELILEGLAQSTLASSFGDISNTTEGLIAILGQFNLEGSQTTEILGSINQVSKDFAVESDDLVQAVRRAGAVFNSSAGDTQNSIRALQEFNAVFTSVRANTRESSETIAAGLRTIFSRLQRRDTIKFLEDFNVQLLESGKFVGQFEAFKRLSEGLRDIDNAVTRSAIAEELGGIRQIGKLIPAIENFADAQAALESGARGAAIGLEEDVNKALQSVSQRVEQTQAIFNKFIKDVFETDAFQNFAKNVLSSTQSLIKSFGSLVEALEPVLPILAALGTFKLSTSLFAFAKSGAGAVATAAAGGGAATQPTNINAALGARPAPTATSKAFNNLTKKVNNAGKSFSTFAKTQLPNFTNALSSASKKVQTTFTNLSKKAQTSNVNLGNAGSIAGQAALGLAIFAATTTEADSAIGKLANQAIGLIGAFLLLGPAIKSAAAQIAAAGVAAQAGTLSAGAALGSSALIVAAPILGALIGKAVGKSVSDSFKEPTQKLGEASGIIGRSIEDARAEGRRASRTQGTIAGLASGAGLGLAIGTAIAPGVGSAIGAAIGGVVGAGVGAISGGGRGIKDAEQQRLLNSNVKLQRASNSLAEAFDNLKNNVNNTNLQAFNNEVRNLTDIAFSRFGAGIQAQINLIKELGLTQSGIGGGLIGGKDFAEIFGGPAGFEIFGFLRGEGDLTGEERRERRISGPFLQELQKALFSTQTGNVIPAGGADERFTVTAQGVVAETEATKIALNSLAEEFQQFASAEIVSEDTKRAINDALRFGVNQAFDKVDFGEIDVTTLETVDEFSRALDEAAKNGDEFAKGLQRLRAQDISARLITVFSDVAKQIATSGTFTTFVQQEDGQALQISLDAQSTEILQGTLATVSEILRQRPDISQEELRTRIDENIKSIANNLGGEIDDSERRQIRRVVNDLIEGLSESSEAALKAGQAQGIARKLQEKANDLLRSFSEELQNIIGNLQIASKDVEVAADNFKKAGRNLSGRGDFQALSINTGAGLGRQGAGLRSDFFAGIERETGIATGSIRNFNNTIANFSDVARETVKVLRQSGEDISPDQIGEQLVKDFEASLGQELPEQLGKAIAAQIGSISRQDTQEDIVNLQSFENAIKQGAFSNINAKVFEELGATTEEVINQFEDLNKNIAIAVNAQAELNKQLRDVDLQSIQRRQAGRQQRDQLFGRAPQGFSGAEADLREQLGAILGGIEEGNDLTAQSLLQRRAALQDNLRLAQERQAEGGLADPQATINEIAGLKTELDATTEALDLLSNETGRLSALTAEANKLIAQRESAQQITRGFLQEAVQNGFTVTAENLEKKLGFVAAAQGEGGVAALSNEQLVGSVEALNTGLSSEIARLQLGDEAFKNLQLELDKETASRIFASLPEGSRTKEAFDDIVKALQVERELADIERTMLQIEKDQLTALNKIAGQDVQQATQDLSILKTAIENQADVISNSIKELNTLLTNVKEGDALRVTEKKDTSPATTTTTTTAAPKVATFEEQVQKEIKRLNDGMFRERRVTQDKTAGLTRLMGGKTLARGVEGASTPTSAILKDGKLVFNNPGGSFLTEADIRKIAEANVKTANAINPPRDPSLIPQGTGAAAGQVKPGEVKAASQANEKSAQALNDAANTLSSATLESTNALAASAQNFNNIAERLDGVAVPETIDVSFSPVNVVGTDQFAQAMEPTLTRIVEESVAKVIAMSLNDRYGGPPVGPGFDPNMA